MHIIHAADLHLGLPVNCPPFGDFDPVEAPWQALDRLIDACLEHRARALLLAGDIFDKGTPLPYVEKRFYTALDRLAQANIPSFMILGNHDADFFGDRPMSAPKSLTQFPHEQAVTEQLTLDGLRLAIHGRSFPVGAVGADFPLSYPSPVDGAVNLALLHTSLDSAGYAQISTNDLLAKGYAYWALGHVHGQAIFGDGARRAAYSGALQGRAIDEPGGKGALLLDVSGAGVETITPLPLSVADWQRLSVDVSGLESRAQVLRQITEALDGLDSRQQRIVRVELVGESALSAELARYADAMLTQLNEVAAASGRLHVERLRVKTERPSAAPTVLSVDWPLETDDVNPDSLRLLTERLRKSGIDLESGDPAPDLAAAVRLAEGVLGR